MTKIEKELLKKYRTLPMPVKYEIYLLTLKLERLMEESNAN